VLAGLPDLIDDEAGVFDIVARRDAATDAGDLLALSARLDRQVWQQCGDVIRLMRTNASAQSDVRAAFDESMRRHRFGIEWTVGKLRDMGQLRPGLSVERASFAYGMRCDE